jgi:acetyl esterase/lipase
MMNKKSCFVKLNNFLVLTACILLIPVGMKAQDGADEIKLLWRDGAPDAKGDSVIDKPTLTVFLPDQQDTTKTGIVIFPGGGYSHLAMEKEGYKVARWFNSLGIAAFVVKYRLGMRYHHPSQLMDGKRAMQMVRKNSQKWHVNPDRIGIMGFSAGGHLASTVGTHFDTGNPNASDPLEKYSSRPDFMILIYPVITMKKDFTHMGSRTNLLGVDPDSSLVQNLSNETQVTPQTPPTFLVHTSNDSGVPVSNSVQFYTALREAGVAAEMHVFEDGPHGFGLARQYDLLSGWTDLCKNWLEHRHLLGNSSNATGKSKQ